MKVKPGDTIIIADVEYKIGNGSSQAINMWLNALEKGIDEGDNEIHLYTKDGRDSGSFRPSKIKEALERK